MAITLSSFLFDQLWARGVRHIFGIPGDFVLNLYEALERDGRFGRVRLSHEPAVGFAADGGLNMVNPVAGAYAEESPLVVLSGGPGRIETRAGLPVHHEVKSFESQLRIHQEVSEYSAILDDPRTAAAHIARALDVAVKMKRPVYLEIPRDMVEAPIDRPAADATLELNTDDGTVRDIVENSDCALLLGELISDTSLGVSAQRLTESNLIICVAREVFVGHHRYQDTPLERVVTGLLESPALASRPVRVAVGPVAVPAESEAPTDDDAPMTVTRLIEAANEFVASHPDVPLVSDTRDCLFAAVEIQSNDCVAPAYYATMGFAVPAALGLQVSSGRRPLVLVGDGAFQMTGAEIAHAGALGCNPIVVLLTLIEVPLAKGDISPVLRRFVAAFKQRVYR